jgi:hypothetical protein
MRILYPQLSSFTLPWGLALLRRGATVDYMIHVVVYYCTLSATYSDVFAYVLDFVYDLNELTISSCFICVESADLMILSVPCVGGLSLHDKHSCGGISRRQLINHVLA